MRKKKEYSKPPNTGNEGKLNKLIQEVEKAYPTSAKSVMKGIGQRAIDVAHEAIGEAHGATVAAQDAEKAAKLLRETIKTLEDAIATTDAVNKKQEKTHSADGQLDSQGQPQTQTLNVERQPQQSAGVSVTGDERQDQKEEKEKDAKETPTTYSNPSASSSSVAAATKTNEQVTATPTKTQEEGDKKTQVNGSNMDSLKKKSANALGRRQQHPCTTACSTPAAASVFCAGLHDRVLNTVVVFFHSVCNNLFTANNNIIATLFSTLSTEKFNPDGIHWARGVSLCENT
ncbi:hypothetical protein LSM04_006758 [Trypanosoma melophagium]|uniref:uncharacterized protein n=1 Tax=Trypanosoma melophagium TaxID=715481 RepID=UPI003519EE95|nr:hypothetical protein LSM04_006758 [Trypanosoma melophagium]